MIFLEINQLFIFIAASIILIIAPGPDLIFLITQSLNHGRKAGLAIAWGLASGNLIHTFVATFGLVLVLQTHNHALSIIQIIGACYLLYLAYQTIRQNKKALSSNTTDHQGHINFFIRGMLMNVLNPKVALFFVSFLPQFIAQDSIDAKISMLFLGISFTVLVVLIFSSIPLFAHQLKQHTLMKSLDNKVLAWLSAGTLIFISIHLFFSI